MILTATQPEELTGVAGWAVDLMDKLGPVGAGLGIALENLFPPLPSEIILPLAGFTAAQGRFTIAEALIWTTLGSVVGALALYLVGALIGRERVYWVGEKLPLVKTSDLEKTEAFFEKYGAWTVFFGRFIPIFRSLISVPAGVTRMPIWKFLILTTVGSAIWNTIFVVAGYQLGDNWEKVEPIVGRFQNIVILVVAVAVVAWIGLRVYKIIRGSDNGAKDDSLVS
ncbi:DedA family protein [Nocardioides sp. NBC_00368]|uniref:DedA family protein n=1 Tax=Nocardioides sp. NBC_00368 TaxID=2976000 RepID=UPI002E1BA51F